MKFLIFTLLTLATVIACAQSSDNRIVEGAYFPNADVQKNYVKNATCDKNVNDITVSGSMTKTATATNRIKGVKSCGLDASAAAETAVWSLFSQEAEWNGQNCEAKFSYLGDASLYRANVLVGTSPQIASMVLTNTGTNKQLASINFPCPASGGSAVTLVLDSTGNGAAITVDDVYVGLATNIGYQSLITGATAYTPTISNFGTAANVNFQYKQVGDELIIQGFFTTGTVVATTASITLPAGFTINASRYSNSGNAVGNYGTNKAGGTGTMLVDPVTNSGLLYFGPNQTGTGNLTPQTGSSTSANTSALSLYARVFVTQLSGATTLTPNLLPAYYFGRHENDCVWTLTSTTNANYTADASCTLTDTSKSNITVTAVGSTRPALAVTFPKLGTWWICATASFYGSNVTGHGYRLWDGTTEIATGTDVSTAEPDTIPLCGPYTNTSLTATLEVQGNTGAGSLTIQAQRGNGARAMHWSIVDLSQNFPAPMLVGSVTSASTGVIRIESAIVSSAGVVSNETGDFLSGNCTGTSAYTCTFNSGFWGATPNCWGTTKRVGGLNRTIDVYSESTTSVVIATATANSGSSALTAESFTLVCMGIK